MTVLNSGNLQQGFTCKARIVFSWQVASHIAHCRPRRFCTEEFKAVSLTSLRTVLQNTGGSEATGSSPIICSTVGQKRGAGHNQPFKHQTGYMSLIPVSSPHSVGIPLSMACVRSNSASENWDCAAEHTQALYTTVSSNHVWSMRGGIPVTGRHGERKTGRGM